MLDSFTRNAKIDFSEESGEKACVSTEHPAIPRPFSLHRRYLSRSLWLCHPLSQVEGASFIAPVERAIGKNNHLRSKRTEKDGPSTTSSTYSCSRETCMTTGAHSGREQLLRAQTKHLAVTSPPPRQPKKQTTEVISPRYTCQGSHSGRAPWCQEVCLRRNYLHTSPQTTHRFVPGAANNNG